MDVCLWITGWIVVNLYVDVGHAGVFVWVYDCVVCMCGSGMGVNVGE